jgi:hypothetical protein
MSKKSVSLYQIELRKFDHLKPRKKTSAVQNISSLNESLFSFIHFLTLYFRL